MTYENLTEEQKKRVDLALKIRKYPKNVLALVIADSIKANIEEEKVFALLDKYKKGYVPIKQIKEELRTMKA
jgi:hypothetical protein